MAVPFRRTSSTKKKQRRSVSNLNWQKRANKPLVNCSNCQKIKRRHWVCLKCLAF